MDSKIIDEIGKLMYHVIEQYTLIGLLKVFDDPKGGIKANIVIQIDPYAEVFAYLKVNEITYVNRNETAIDPLYVGRITKRFELTIDELAVKCLINRLYSFIDEMNYWVLRLKEFCKGFSKEFKLVVDNKGDIQGIVVGEPGKLVFVDINGQISNPPSGLNLVNLLAID